MSTTSASGLTGLSSSLLGLSIVAVALRIYTRQMQKLELKADDWITLPCLFLFLGTTSTTFYGIHHSILGHPTPKSLTEAAEIKETAAKLYVAFNLFSIATLACIKISALLFYRRIFCVHGRHGFFNAVTIFTVVVIVLWIIGYMILAGLSCGSHFSALWSSRKDFNKYCGAAHKFLLSLSISDFLLDLWILGLPIPQIWALNITAMRKFAVTGVFLLAFAGLGASIARMVVYIQLDNGTIPIHDSLLANTESIYLTVLECGLSLIAVNLPSLWTLVSKTTPERVLQSVRSILSLHSTPSASSRSNGNQASSSVALHYYNKRSESSSSQSRIVQPGADTAYVRH